MKRLTPWLPWRWSRAASGPWGSASPSASWGDQPSGELLSLSGAPHPRHRGRHRSGRGATKTFLGQLLAFYGLAIALRPAVVLAPLLRSRLWRTNCVVCPSSCASWWICTTSAPKPWPSLRRHPGCDLPGRGINARSPLRGLKLKEISYIHAEGYPAGEMKHGPIALLDSRVPVVSIAVPGRCLRRCSVTATCQGPRRPADRCAPRGPTPISLMNCCRPR